MLLNLDNEKEVRPFGFIGVFYLIFMKEPYINNITLFRSLFDSKETPYIISIEDVYERIKTGMNGVDKLVLEIRSKQTKAERNVLKKNLKAILFAGEFTQRNDNSLKSHSGFMIADFDDFTNDVELNYWIKKLKNDVHVYMLFISPSGNGFKAVIRIPKSNANEHKLRHEAFANYIKCDYFDTTNKNVSRVCFESYDPNIYLNVFAEEFTLMEQDKGYTYQEKAPICILRNEQEIINRIMKFEFGFTFTEGSRNEYIFRVACCFNEYGIDKNTCENYLWNNVVNGKFDHQEFITSVKSAYKKTNSGSKYFDDHTTIKNVENDIKRGVPVQEVKKKHNVDDDVIEDVQDKIDKEDEVFWNIKKKKDGEAIVTINEWKYCEFLIKNGFLKYYPENAEKPSFVRVVENKVNLISTAQIKDFVLEFLREQNNIDVWNYCSRHVNLFTEKYLDFIESIDLLMLSDTKDKSFIPFKNGVVEVTKNNYKLIPFVDVDGYIWEKQIIPRNFKKLEDNTNDFKDFINKVSAKDQKRYNALCSTLGYLIHAHKDKTDQKAIIFNDQEVDDNPNGGSGKSLVLTSLSHFRRLVKIDGKTFNPAKSDFVYQRVSVDTQILGFDDVKRNFNFEQLFSLITEGITVNRKNKDEIFIPFERSAKIVITTNYVINGAGNSHDRRRHEIEFFQYFNNKKTPLDEYGKLLFDQWNKEDWERFDNFMISNLQLYLKDGLIQGISINADVKRFIQSTSKDFADWVEDENLKINVRNYTSESIDEFKKEYKEYHSLSPRIFVTWCKKYAEFKGYEFMKGKCSNTNKRYFVISDGSVKIETDEPIPF